MIPDKIKSILKIIYDRIYNQDIFWILSGSTSLAIQGVDVQIHDDIDIVTDQKGVQQVDQLLSDFRIKEPEYSSTDNYKSYFGIYQIGNVKVEVMGEFQYRLQNGGWSRPVRPNKIIKKEYQGMVLPLLPLAQEVKEYQNLGKFDKVNKIKKTLFLSRF